MAEETAAVERFIDDAPEDRKPALNALRTACLGELDGLQESMQYGMPSYLRAGEVEVVLALTGASSTT